MKLKPDTGWLSSSAPVLQLGFQPDYSRRMRDVPPKMVYLDSADCSDTELRILRMLVARRAERANPLLARRSPALALVGEEAGRARSEDGSTLARLRAANRQASNVSTRGLP